MAYIFTSEAVSEGHPDKIADQISDAILDNFLAYDENARVACETMVTTGQAILCGEVKSKHYVDLQDVVRKTITNIGYTKSEYCFDADSCSVLSAIHEQSDDINRGIDKENEMEQGAGDQGIIFGYACNENDAYIPLTLYLSQMLVKGLAYIRKNTNLMPYLRPDAKSQVSIVYSDDNVPQSIHTIVISTQHDEFGGDEEMQEKIRHDVETVLIPYVASKIKDAKIAQMLLKMNYSLLVNPTGKFVIGGPHGDTGLTGRKIIVDTYGGRGAHGGGAFSGKDASKVDRSAAYMARYIAKNLVAAGISDEILIQLSYAIGKSRPISVFVNTYGKCHIPNLTDRQIAIEINALYDLRPKAIEKKLKLNQPMYTETAAYGHFGRECITVEKEFTSKYYVTRKIDVELFTWEKLDDVERIKRAFIKK